MTLKPSDASDYLETLARFRIKYFREYPYLYDGSMDYEAGYIESFRDNDKAILLIAKDGDKVVGVSTAMPLVSDSEIKAAASRLLFEKKIIL